MGSTAQNRGGIGKTGARNGELDCDLGAGQSLGSDLIFTAQTGN